MKITSLTDEEKQAKGRINQTREKSFEVASTFVKWLPPACMTLIGFYLNVLKDFINLTYKAPVLQDYLVYIKVLMLIPLLALTAAAFIAISVIIPKKTEGILNNFSVRAENERIEKTISRAKASSVAIFIATIVLIALVTVMVFFGQVNG